MNAHTRVVLIASGLGVAAGIAYPLIDLALACQNAHSEACVWGKAYLPLSLGISIPVIGGLTGTIVYGFFSRRIKAGTEKKD